MFLKALIALAVILGPPVLYAQEPPATGFISDAAVSLLPVYGNEVLTAGVTGATPESQPGPQNSILPPTQGPSVPIESIGPLVPSVVPLPATYDLRPHLPAPGNQAFSDCSAWAVAYATMSGRLAATRNRKPTEPCEIFSPAYLYSQVEHKPGVGISVYSGHDPSGRSSAIAFVLKNGCATQATVPYSSNGEQIPECVLAKASSEAKYLRQFFPQLELNVLPTLKRIQRAIADDYVVISEVRYDDAFRARDGMGATEDSVYRWSGKSGNLHAVCIVGYDDKKANGRPALLIMNSWGSDWKNGGFCWVDANSYDKGFFHSAVVLCDAASRLPETQNVADVKIKLERDRSIIFESKQAYRLSPQGWRYSEICTAGDCLFSLRDNGGVYFLAKEELAKLRSAAPSNASTNWIGIPYQLNSPAVTMTVATQDYLVALDKEGAIRAFGRFGTGSNLLQHWLPLKAPGNEPAIDLHLVDGKVRATVKSGTIYELQRLDKWVAVEL